MLKKMNLPNKLTLLRITLVPFFIIFMALPNEWIWPLYVSLAIFIIAALTDKLDGYLARKYNLITDFGKIMDPLADKLIVSTGFIMLVGVGVIPAWMIAVVVARDFFVNGLRMFGADKNKNLAAGLSGKIKTVFQMITIPFGILGLAINAKYSSFGIIFEKSMLMSPIELLVNILMTMSMAAVLLSTMFSFVDYFIRFKEDFIEEEEVVENQDDQEKEEIEEIESSVDKEVSKEETTEKEDDEVVEEKEETNVEENKEKVKDENNKKNEIKNSKKEKQKNKNKV